MNRVLYLTFLFLILSYSAFPQTEQGSGVATGVAKVYTTRRTAGIVDENAPKVFEDVTAKTDVKNFSCVSGSKEKNYIVETTGCAVAVIDYDNDGSPDVYLLNGSAISGALGKE